MKRTLLVSISSGLLMLGSSLSHAQSTLLREDFTGSTTLGQWYYFNGACLTASGTAPGANPGLIPGCTAIRNSYYGENLTGGTNGDSTSNQTLPDPAGQGALRFTNGSPGGYNQNGAIISAQPYSTAQGLNITFATISYRGNKAGNGGGGNNNNAADPGYNLPISANDGADGMSFFLLNGNTTPTGSGSYGGSLGYTCSNNNPDYTGIPGGYLGLGIDEYGNFLNPGDNTNSGPGLQANRIGLRGAGSISFNSLVAQYPAYYPANLSTLVMTLPNGGTTLKNGNPGTAAQWALYDTCRTGMVWDYSQVTDSTKLNLKSQTNIAISDYPVIPNGYTVLSGVSIANEFAAGGYARTSTGTAPIYYRLRITANGLLSLQYSYNGGAYVYVLQNQSLATINGGAPLPASLYFGFAGSTGGATNIHEILCFQAAPATQAASSASTTQRQGSQLNSTSQSFFSFYNPNDWTGRITANALVLGGTDANPTLTIAGTPTWDASCGLTGETSAQCSTGQATTVQGPSARQILTWNGSQGVPFQFASLSSTQQLALTTLDSVSLGGVVAAATCAPSCRLNYLRGDRTGEVDVNGVGLFRDRNNVLGDVIDSSPVWVGPPSESLPKVWRDRINPTLPSNPFPENSGQSYANYTLAQQTRTNVVYVGSNDGMLHGFRAGSTDVFGALTPAIANDGYEVMAYVPGSVIASQPTAAASSALLANNCTSLTATPTQVQNIHGAVPVDGFALPCTQAALDYSNTQYGHDYYVDGTPSSGDIFYNAAWHTWLVGSLGYGGAGIYALDVTNPTSITETNAKAVVMGEWTPSTLTCANVVNCGNNLGQVTGTPVLRRMHTGQWAVIFGNGINSASGDAGVYIMLIPQTGVSAPVPFTTYYLSTGVGVGGKDGISYVVAADLDNDSISDYIYGGDIQGNVWRFDVTEIAAASWGVNPTVPLFKTKTGQPITTRLVVSEGPGTQAVPQVMVGFGTGEKYPLTNTNATSYQTGIQSIYGFWDYDMTQWNSISSMQYAVLSRPKELSCVSGTTLRPTNLAQQTVSIAADLSRHVSVAATILWPTPSSCTGKFGWEIDLPASQEQIVFSPEFVSGGLLVNSLVPATSSLLSCNIQGDTGATYFVSMLDGSPVQNFFQNYSNDTIGLFLSGSGTPAVVTNALAEGHTWLVQQGMLGNALPPLPVNRPVNVSSGRMTWKQIR